MSSSSGPCSLCKKKCYDRNCVHCFAKFCFKCYDSKHARSCKKKDNSWESYPIVAPPKKSLSKQRQQLVKGPLYSISSSDSDSERDSSTKTKKVFSDSDTPNYNLELNIQSSSSDSETSFIGVITNTYTLYTILNYKLSNNGLKKYFFVYTMLTKTRFLRQILALPLLSLISRLA